MKLTKKERAIFDIYNKLLSVHSSICGKCGLQEDVRCDSDLDAADLFHERGWYATEKKLYCTNCKKPQRGIQQK